MLAPLVIVCVVAFTPENTLTLPTTGVLAALVRGGVRAPGFRAVVLEQPAARALRRRRCRHALAVPAGLAITRYEFPGRDFLNGLFLSPLIIPHLVLGVALLRLFALVGGDRQLRLARRSPTS